MNTSTFFVPPELECLHEDVEDLFEVKSVTTGLAVRTGKPASVTEGLFRNLEVTVTAVRECAECGEDIDDE